jgi:hypothetical protein
LVYLRARWYNPNTGTFTSRDPFPGVDTVPQSLHPYAYTHNNPVNATDPSGKVIWYHQFSKPPYHRWIEEKYEATNPLNIHIEFNQLPGVRWRIDVLNPVTGDVYEIKPIDEITTGFAEVTAYIGALKLAQGFGALTPTHPSGQHYDWNQVFWGYGAPSNYGYQVWGWGPFRLVAMAPIFGVIAYWIEPADPSAAAWFALAQSKNRRELIRPYGWQPGMPVPDPSAPLREPVPAGTGVFPQLPSFDLPIVPIPGRGPGRGAPNPYWCQ